MEELILKQKQKIEQLEEEAITGDPSIDSLSLENLMHREDLSYNRSTRAFYIKRFNALCAIKDINETISLLQSRDEKIVAMISKRLDRGFKTRESRKRPRELEVFGNITSQSAVGDMDEGGTTDDVQENLHDFVGEPDKPADAGASMRDDKVGSTITHTLDEFFARPVLIYDDTWATGAEQDLSFAIWDLWSKDAAVRAKLSNYAYFRADMHVRVSISGTPFHYGRTMLSYQPYPAYNSTLSAYDTMLAAPTIGADALPAYKTYLSQAKGTAYVDFKNNQPVEMKLPFISYKPVHRLWNNAGTVITNATSYEDLAEAGDLRVVTLNAPDIANEDFDSNISVNIYAWCTNVQLGCITSTDINITAQSFVEKMQKNNIVSGEGSLASRVMDNIERGNNDEYNAPGPLGITASAIAGVAKNAGDLPIIGPLATATAGFMGKAASFLNIYGFSKPVILEKAVYVKNNPYTNAANCSGNETTHRLTADPKQELTIDPLSGGGDGVDEMAIQAITSRASFLDTFEWSSSDVANTSILWQTFVTPQACTRVDFTVADDLIQPTALCFATQPFTHWRGNIKYRFEFVCSKFHRGKVLIKYEPNSAGKTLIDAAATKTNQQNVVIVDLQETQDITIEVGWSHYRHWCRTYRPQIANIPNDISHLDYSASAGPSNTSYGHVNGFLEVRPLNELVQPTDLSTVKVNVYVWSDDMQCAFLSDGAMPTNRTYITSQSAVEPITHTINPSDANIDSIHLENFGEKVVSFRYAMKRFTGLKAIEATAASGGKKQVRAKINRFPYGELHPSTIAVDDGTYRYNLYYYLAPAYLGVRGSMRYRIRYISDNFEPNILDSVIVTQAGLTNLDNRPFLQVSDLASLSNALNMMTAIEGSTIYHLQSNGGIEFEMPYYSANLFQFACNPLGGNGVSGATTTGFDEFTNNYADVRLSVNAEPADVFRAIIDSAIGEDFTFTRFLGAPFYEN